MPTLAEFRDRLQKLLLLKKSKYKAKEASLLSLLDTLKTTSAMVTNDAMAIDYIKVASDSEYLKGNTADDFEVADHTHSEYLRANNVFGAVGFYDESRPKDYAKASHTHMEYLKRTETAEVAQKLGGKDPSEYARTEHTHDNLVPIGVTVGAATIIDGMTVADLAPKEHTHSEYHLATDIVSEATVFVDSNDEIQSPSIFASADHEHEDYITKEEATAWLVTGDVMPNADKIEVNYIDFKYSDIASLDYQVNVGTNYDYTQTPFVVNGFPCPASISVTIDLSEAAAYAVTEPIDLWLMPGTYVSLSVEDEVLGILPHIEVIGASGNLQGKSNWISIYYSGNNIVVKALDFYDAFSALKVRLIVFVKSEV